MFKAYEQLASLYDYYMAAAPYDQWQAYLEEIAKHFPLVGKSLLDLGCGTGTLTLKFKKSGYEVVGVDLSEEMLTVAKGKADDEGLNIPLYQQDITELELPNSFDIITSFCDTINYLEDLTAVRNCFQSVYNHLNDEGIFLFDVHSVRKIDEIFSDNTFGSVEEDVTYIWECFKGEESHSVYHDLSFFLRQEDDLYQRFDESHYQRTYSIDTYIKVLEETGFKVHTVIGDFSADIPLDQAERWLFAVTK